MVYFSAGKVESGSTHLTELKPQGGLKRLAEHGNGIALTFARTETDMFFRWGWECADAMLFIRGRLHFYSVKGERAKANAGGPSVLIAYGSANAERLKLSRIGGWFVQLTPPPPADPAAH